MAKRISYYFSIALHPLIMTVLGLLIMFNSGTSLSVLQAEVKNITLIIVGLFTVIFPFLLIILLYFTKSIKDPALIDNRDQLLALSLIFIFYLFTFLIIRGIPQLTAGHVLFMLCAPVALFFSILAGRFYRNSIHMVGFGMLYALLIVLVVFLGASIQLIFVLITLAGGSLATSRMILEIEKPGELILGFGIGFLVTGLIMTIYVL